jgi:AcrR family transcriptional regulator
MVDVNCRAVLALCHGVAPRLQARGRGGIVLLSSLFAFQGSAGIGQLRRHEGLRPNPGLGRLFNRVMLFSAVRRLTSRAGLSTVGPMSKPSNPIRDLPEACVREALAIIEDVGIEKLSLREVSRRLGVSHQAPYKHFPSRDHLLAEVVARAFDAFAAHLEQRPRTGDPRKDLGSMGVAYIQYALAHPLQYRLMFGTPLPDPEAHPRMMEKARFAFRLLQDAINALPNRTGQAEDDNRTSFDALFIWSTIHGLSSILRSHAVDTLGMDQRLLDAAIPETLARIGSALAAPPEVTTASAGEAEDQQSRS